MVTVLKQKCARGELYNLNREITVDEAMIQFKGRLGFKQYIKSKPTKWGIKVFVLADAKNGYVSDFTIYTGKEEGADPSEGLCTRAVIDLVRPLEGRHHHLYTDNFYTAVQKFKVTY